MPLINEHAIEIDVMVMDLKIRLKENSKLTELQSLLLAKMGQLIR